MKKVLQLGILIVLMACGGVKKTQEAVNLGDYKSAIDLSIKNLAQNKEKKGNQPYVILLEEAYQRNTERELERIAFLEKDDNPVNYEDIYKCYRNLKRIQGRIRPLLPLLIKAERRDAIFEFNNYDDKILDAKEQLSEYLYDEAEGIMLSATSKYDYRKAYNDLVYLNKINPGFEDT